MNGYINEGGLRRYLTSISHGPVYEMHIFVSYILREEELVYSILSAHNYYGEHNWTSVMMYSVVHITLVKCMITVMYYTVYIYEDFVYENCGDHDHCRMYNQCVVWDHSQLWHGHLRVWVGGDSGTALETHHMCHKRSVAVPSLAVGAKNTVLLKETKNDPEMTFTQHTNSIPNF